MKFTIAAAALVTLAASTNAAKPYTLHAIKTDSNGTLDQQINANNHRFWVNKATSSYCNTTAIQSLVAISCPPGNVTSFETSNKTTSLNVEVPGGQVVFIKENGIVSYTEADTENLPRSAAIIQGLKKILLSNRIWLCHDQSDDAGAYYLTVARHKTTLPQQAKSKNNETVCTRAKLRLTNLKSDNATAWQYV